MLWEYVLDLPKDYDKEYSILCGHFNWQMWGEDSNHATAKGNVSQNNEVDWLVLGGVERMTWTNNYDIVFISDSGRKCSCTYLLKV